MPASPEPRHRPGPARNSLEQAEDLFVALAQSHEMGPWLGRFHEAGEDELRAVFGLAVASIRRTQAAGEAPEPPAPGQHPAAAGQAAREEEPTPASRSRRRPSRPAADKSLK